MKYRKPLFRRGETPTCPRCGVEKNLSAFKRVDDGVCRRCVKTATVAAVHPTPRPDIVDLVLGHDLPGNHGTRNRIVRVQRVDGVIRLLAGVRLDRTAVHIFGTFTVPLRHVAALRAALAKLVP